VKFIVHLLHIGQGPYGSKSIGTVLEQVQVRVAFALKVDLDDPSAPVELALYVVKDDVPH